MQAQREKLLRMKQKERENMLTAEAAGPTGASRPMSARIARSVASAARAPAHGATVGSGQTLAGRAVQSPSSGTLIPSDKELAIRRAIAARLKDEVLHVNK